MFRWLPQGANYPPDGPWPGKGRFDTGEHKTLYLAATAEGAMAEFFRRFPELLEIQDDLIIGFFEVELEVSADCVDVRTPSGAAVIGIELLRLRSSEPDELSRYAECRALAVECITAGFVGLAYPSAASVAETWNLVLFGEQSEPGWHGLGYQPVPRPRLTSVDVRSIES